MDQRTCIKFCVKNEIKCADAFRMLTVAYGEATLDRSKVYRWYKMFSEGREDVNDEERAGRPSTSTTDEKINEVEKMILANRRITVREVAEDLNISIGSCHSIFINDLGMRRVAAKFVPKLLNCDQKQHRMNIANEMLDSVRDDPNLLQRVITGDEAWVYDYDVETDVYSCMFERFDENLENVENYIYRLKQFMLISKTKEVFKTPFLISCIGPKYFGILRNLVFPEEVDQVPFDKLCKILLKHFNPKTNIIYERFVFQKMDQKSGEAISKYIIRLKEQAQRCNFGDFLQESLRDRFVAGIIDTPTQKKLLQEEGLTFEGALDIALSAESADKDLHNLKRSEDAHRSPQHLHAINNPCKHCGKNKHLHYNCFFKSANCRVCGRVGHISTICYKKDSSARKLPRNPKNTFNKFKKHANDNNPSRSQNNLSLNNINLHPPLTETVYVNNIKLLAEIDTGAAITTLTKYEYFKYFKNVKLNKCNTVLTGYSGSKIPILGKAKFDIKLRNVSRTIEILITNLNCSKFLLGRDFLNLFNISFNYLHKLDSFSIDSLLNDYESIFECKSDPIKGIKCHLDVKADFIPKFYKFRLPFALKQLVENEIDKLVDLNILSPIGKSECASPLVCVAKPNGQIRLCADFKKSLNPYLEDVKYPIPNIDSVLCNFQGKKLFTKLDLSKAYHQIEMDDISKKYLVVSTHKGLYKYNRLAFGIKTASEIFQKTMESFFSGINDVYIYFDDILIASEDLESHLDILKRTLNIFKENNFTINKNKCLFVKNEIEYLGHKINEFGIYPLKDKLACIKNCPVPKNITELKSFLGFLSFYSKFLPNLSDLAYPLYNLLKKNVRWSWNAGTDRSFNSCKNALDETTCLSHYSLNLPLILSCDGSQVGIGATLSHLKDGEERPVCFISRTLNVHERKYSQVEREGLAIVFAVNKLKNYLFGRKFTIYTDHKPLITIFGDKTNLPPLIANRLHRWALTLSNYSFEIKYKKGKDNIFPDFLSRFPECQEDNLEYNDGSGEILLLNTSIIDHVLVAHEIQLDRTLFKLYKIIETGELPSSPNDDLIPYLKRIDDFTILQECIFLENRMVIPKILHERVLQILHESHAGTNKMKMMARSSIWWPGMDSSIEIITKNCRTCLSNESLPPQRTESWPKYAGPWRRVHMDYFNFKNKLFLLAVDSFSSWVEVSEVPSTSAYFCINFMRNCIARYGFPQVVVSDNGPPFFSSDFGDFLSKNGISHVTSPPYHPQSNGQAEVSVREVKKLLKKQLYENEQVELNLALSRALFFIRTDVNIRKGTSPADLFLGRKIRSRLSVLSKEEVKASKFNSQYVNSKFKVDETVKFRWITNGHPSWYTGKIIKILGRNVYLIKQGDSIKKVHQNYIRKMLPGKSHPTNMNDAVRVPTPISEEKSITTPRGVVHHEFLPQGRTVNKEYYLQVMRNLREAIRQKRPDLWKHKNWLLHHDNAPAHTLLACARLFGQKQHTNDAAATVFPRSGPLPEQFGYQAKHPTLHQLVVVTEKIRKAMDLGQITGAVFYHIAKAFDKVWHEALLYKMCKKPLPGEIIKITENFLTNRTFKKKKDKIKKPLDELFVFEDNFKWKENIRYQGMTLDEHLTFKKHIENRINLAKAAQNRLSLLLGPKSKLSLHCKRTIHTSIIRPILIYGHPIFMTAHKTLLKKLEVFENKIIRKIMSPPWFVRNTILRNDIKIENFNDYIIRQSFKFYEKSEKLENPTFKEATNYKYGKRKIKNLKPGQILHQDGMVFGINTYTVSTPLDKDGMVFGINTYTVNTPLDKDGMVFGINTYTVSTPLDKDGMVFGINTYTVSTPLDKDGMVFGINTYTVSTPLDKDGMVFGINTYTVSTFFDKVTKVTITGYHTKME
ncbi:K02A2.6-like [Cordylochernes scorpioides]|uniref:RNA-directed DNA polymerase n=1 Tax=Cordylochernes scorpioides TaxID=51811 RepID=A0ABY6LE39_9ARAC|nr:K02A2.6-like [Cordylochernes scorpioides]